MQEFLGIKIPQSLDEVISPANTALIVYDMQVGIIPQIKNGHEITKQVSRLLAAVRAAGVRTYFTRHMSLPKEQNGNGMAACRFSGERETHLRQR